MVNIKREFARFWKDSPALTGVSCLMLAVLIPSVAGIFLDPRTITGAPAWLKPSKFAISTAIYAISIAWLFRYLTLWPRFNRAAGRVIAVVFVIEVGIIDLQAARGTTSHFNASTPLDMSLFVNMGIAIAVLWLFSAGLTVELFRQRFDDRAWGWALRAGMLISVLGSSIGGLMLTPTKAQISARRAGQVVLVNGAHTVGAPDGGPGLPGVDWSTQHGDLRISHFLGLHALQIVPLFAWAVRKRRRSGRMVLAGAASYFALMLILLWQALRGQPLVHPDPATLSAMGAWLGGTILGMRA